MNPIAFFFAIIAVIAMLFHSGACTPLMNNTNLDVAENALFHPCSKKDIACLTKSAQAFLEKTSAGIPKYGFKPIDPMTIHHVEIPLESGDKVHLNNVRVTKVKSLGIHDFKIDTSEKSVVLCMDGDLEIVADIEVEIKDEKHTGTFSAKGKVISTAKYNYDLVPNDKGVEYFTVGPETIACELQGSPKTTLDNGIDTVLYEDGTKKEEITKQVVCSVITPAFNTIIHNLRQSAKFYPKTYYFTDL